MPVRRFRSLAECEATTRRAPGSADLLATMRLLWSLSSRLCPPRFPPGVHPHRSLEDANRLVEQWEAAATARRRG
jgi:hypothetical protein